MALRDIALISILTIAIACSGTRAIYRDDTFGSTVWLISSTKDYQLHEDIVWGRISYASEPDFGGVGARIVIGNDTTYTDVNGFFNIQLKQEIESLHTAEFWLLGCDPLTVPLNLIVNKQIHVILMESDILTE